MAEAILFNVAAKIIESLGSQALKEIGLLWGVTDELDKLKNTVSTIQAVLLDAEEQWAVNREVKDWLEKLKYVVYDADDLLDGFSTDSLLREMMTQDKMAKKDASDNSTCKPSNQMQVEQNYTDAADVTPGM
ncbi:disease resistance protein RGA2-like isoform X3 [Carya illinoinensis]|uniref:disease resistance protein RGA2-like isoform X3 n=1 Tax=Carya illinoinensis TaxID=32201 RepID=UPI001C71B066|nr:disease resistance protein RGA2-like isoform X3 [Carya illinoinensis]